MINKLEVIINKHIIFYTIVAICFIFSIVFVYNNHRFYERPIAKVIQTTVTETTETMDLYENEDMLFTQQMTAEIKNGEQKGQHIHIVNEHSSSGAYDFSYNTGDELFVSIDQDSTSLTGSITDVKRDKYVVVVMWIFIFTLLLVGRRQGLFATISLAINMILLSYALDIYVNTQLNLLWICGITAILFTVTSLLLVNGRNEKTYAAIIATILGTFISLFIAYLAIWFTSEKGLYYEEMSFLTRPYQLVFLAGLFIGAIGAVMDVAISISSALYELYQKDHHISNNSLKKSGFNIGKDIMGTMTNILFFAYISGSIPILIVYFKNSSPLGFALSLNLSLEIARALAGGIGIVITIPIGIYTSIFFINRKRAKS
ncbi:YibE/F family protein [Amphibacillus sp. Q70]|uniref:YibE/F family protein n=1 Tax=Amphibacillus sp. Q70 TaxID=3453416 RepID=UPI003F827833